MDAEFKAHPDEEKDRNFVTALARGLDVLRCFRPNETELTNNDISERTGLPKPTVSRLTHTLCKLDYLVADSRTGTYRLSAGVLQLGYGVLAGMEIGERAADAMRALRNGPNSYITCALAERHRLDAVYVAVQRSREEISLIMRIGSRLPLFFSAIGRAILVGMNDKDRSQVFDFANAQEPEEKEARQASFERAMEEYLAKGFCTGYGDWRPDVNGIAVPVFSLNGDRVYGLNVGGPAFHVKKKQLESHYAKLLINAARTLSSGPPV
jgi:DNA-binding IclR family transcriptional regulator